MANTTEGRRKAFASRLKEATGCYNISELSQFFDVAHSTVSSWIADRKLPAHQQHPIRLRGVNPEWVLSGRGKKYVTPPVRADICENVKIACPLKADLQRMLKTCAHCSAWAAFLQSHGLKQ